MVIRGKMNRELLIHIKHISAAVILCVALAVIFIPLFQELDTTSIEANKPLKIPKSPYFAKSINIDTLISARFGENFLYPTEAGIKNFLTPSSREAVQSSQAWVVILDTLAASTDKVKYIQSLQTEGYPAYLAGPWIQIGPFLERDQAESVQEALNRVHLGGRVVPYNPLKE